MKNRTRTCERCTGRIGSVAGGATPPSQFDDKTLRIAVTEWLDDPDNAKAKYGHISNWDTTNVTSMTRLFQKKGDQFNEPLNDWNTHNVTNMHGMFSFARAFNQPLHKWDTGQVTEMRFMFLAANQFNQPLNNWNTSQVTDTKGMFYFAQFYAPQTKNFRGSNKALRMLFERVLISGSPKRVLTSLISTSKTHTQRFVQPSKIFVWGA